MSQANDTLTRAAYSHEAVFYQGTDEFVQTAGEYIDAALGAASPVFVAVADYKIASLKQAFGARASGISFVDTRTTGRNPAQLLPAWSRFVDRHASESVVGVSEPVEGRPAAAVLRECQVHDELFDVAFSPDTRLKIHCLFDRSALTPAAVQQAQRCHFPASLAAAASGAAASGAADTADAAATTSEPARTTSPFTRSLPLCPTSVGRLSFDAGSLQRVRAHIANCAHSSGMPGERGANLVTAVNEVATNCVQHGDGRGSVAVWAENGSLIVDVAGGEEIRTLLAGRSKPALASPAGRGLWIANHLCDLVQIYSSSRLTLIRLHMRIDEDRPESVAKYAAG